jgi:L,D-transpeptidase YbiS
MAMRRNFLFILIPIVLVLIALMAILFSRQEKLPDDQAAIYIDSTYTQLPADDKKAQKELQRARKVLNQMKPKKPYIVIDTHANKLSLRTEDSLFYKATCSTGSGGVLIDSLTGRKWIFNTPRGIFKINSKLKQPWWRKPDWAFIEEAEEIPDDERERYDPEMLGEYAMGFGDGYFIHGTIYERLLGVSVTHGCVRLGSDDLHYIFERVGGGTQVLIF